MSKKKTTKNIKKKNTIATEEPVEVKIHKKFNKKLFFKQVGAWILLIVMVGFIFAEAFSVMFG